MSLTGVLTVGTTSSGTITINPPAGESFAGAWHLLKPGDAVMNSLSNEWDRVFGSGFFAANVLGNRVLYDAVATNPQGAKLHLQMIEVSPGRTQGLKGVAVDTDGNIFKVTI